MPDLPVQSVPDDGDQPLDQRAALAMIEHLCTAARVLQDQADQWALLVRGEGGSWSAIGRAMGVDRTAVYRRLSALHDVQLGTGDGPGVRYSEPELHLTQDADVLALEARLDDAGV